MRVQQTHGERSSGYDGCIMSNCAYSFIKWGIAAAILTSCGGSSPFTSAQLCNNIPSGINVHSLLERQDFVGRLRHTGGDITGQLLVGGGPGRVIMEVKMPYEHLGIKGDIEMVFLGERLMSTTFIPTDYEAYVRELDRAGEIGLFESEKRGKNRRVVKVRGGGVAGVLWVDAALEWEYHSSS